MTSELPPAPEGRSPGRGLSLSRRNFLVSAGLASVVAAVYSQNQALSAQAANSWNHPLDFRGRIERPYGYNVAYTEYSDRFHKGLDYRVPTGTVVHPVSSGVVASAGWNAAGQTWAGYSVLLRHNDGMHSYYAHLSGNVARQGENVNPSTVLGQSGSTGQSTGPHLHLEIWNNASRAHRDPQPLIHNAPLPTDMSGGGNFAQGFTEDNVIIIFSTSKSSDGVVLQGRTYADPLTGPLVLLSALEAGALEYWNGRGVPYRRAEWSGNDVRSVISVRGVVEHDPTTGKSNYASIRY